MADDPLTLARIKQTYANLVVEGCARSLWVHAYMEFRTSNGYCNKCAERIHRNESEDWVNEDGEDGCPDGGVHEIDHDVPENMPFAPPGKDWYHYAPPTVAAAYACAQALVHIHEQLEGMSIADLFELAMTVAQGDFEWFEEARHGEDSTKLREAQQTKRDAAEAFGGGLADALMEIGANAWDDNYKTKRGNAVFQRSPVRGEFNLVDFDLIHWLVMDPRHPDGSRRGRDHVWPQINVFGDVGANFDPFDATPAEALEFDRNDHRGFDSMPEHACDVLRDEGGASMEVIAGRYNDQDSVFYKSRDVNPNGVRVSFFPTGMTPDEKEWLQYFYTERIGRIAIVNKPSSSESYSYQSRSPGHDGVSDGNILFWFGDVSPKLLLVFGTNISDALGECFEWLEEWAPGIFDDTEVAERREELVAEACRERGLPDPNMLPDRVLEQINEEAKSDYTQSGDSCHYIRSDHFGIYAENLSLEDLRRIGNDGPEGSLYPAPTHVTAKKNPVTVLPFAHRPTSAASRSRR